MVETPPGHLSAINPTPAGTTALTAPGRDEAIAKNLTRQLELIDYATAFGRSNIKIAVLPEYGINGAWEERSVEEWIRCALEIPNPWTDLLAEKARERNLYICANMLEKILDVFHSHSRPSL